MNQNNLADLENLKYISLVLMPDTNRILNVLFKHRLRISNKEKTNV